MQSSASERKMRLIGQYVTLVGTPLLLLLGILHAGARLEAPAIEFVMDVTRSSTSVSMPNLVLLLVQIAVILFTARLIGVLFRSLRQPQVVGEMLAGILLGPSFLGWLAPQLSSAIFPSQSLGFLTAISQLGLIVFMFLIGAKVDPNHLRSKRDTAVLAGHASIVVPFLLGALLALWLYPRLSNRGVPFLGFALFMGAAMSVTAFPVLARILNERGLIRTRIGVLTLTCAAIGDVTAWLILAGVVALVRAASDSTPLWTSLGGSIAFIAFMVFITRPVVHWLNGRFQGDGPLTHDRLAAVLLLALISAAATEWLGIHALFGAFLAGTVMPKDTMLVRTITEKLEDATVVLLLPLFFAFTGLRTSVGLLSGWQMTLTCALIVAVAVAGKFGGSTVAARLTGSSWREAAALGVFMNTRGLMELVIVNIALDLGVISPTLFTMMVMMALVTTLMTTPLLEWIYPLKLIRAQSLAAESR